MKFWETPVPAIVWMSLLAILSVIVVTCELDRDRYKSKINNLQLRHDEDSRIIADHVKSIDILKGNIEQLSYENGKLFAVNAKLRQLGVKAIIGLGQCHDVVNAQHAMLQSDLDSLRESSERKFDSDAICITYTNGEGNQTKCSAEGIQAVGVRPKDGAIGWQLWEVNLSNQTMKPWSGYEKRVTPEQQ